MTGLDPEKHKTITETAALMGVHERTVWRYVEKGLLGAFRHANRTYVHTDNIDEYFRTLQAQGDALRMDRAKARQ